MAADAINSMADGAVAAAAFGSVPVAATRAIECPAALQQIGRSPQLPSPIMADYNLDGQFTSEDFVTYYHDRVYLPLDSTSETADDISEEFDLVESMQWTPYEGGHVRDATHPCAIYEIASNAMPSLVSTDEQRSQDGSRLEQTSINIGSPNRPNYQAVSEYGENGQPSTYTLNIYRVGEGVLYSRMQVQYDAQGRVHDHLTWVYDDDGRLERSTTSSVYYEDQGSYRSTRVEYFDDTGERKLGTVKYFNDQSREVAAETTQYRDGTPVLVVRSRYDRSGRALDPAPLADPNFWTSRHTPRSQQPAFLQEVQDAYRATADMFRAQYAEVLRMNRLPSQENLPQIIKALGLSRDEEYHLRRLNEYFNLALDMARKLDRHEYNFDWMRERYSFWLDPVTGDWSEGFKSFVADEGLVLPLPPLRVAGALDELSQVDREALVSKYHESMGDDPAAYFQANYRNPAAHVRDLLEGLRYAKARIKIAEYRMLDKFPSFERIIAPDQPDRETLGLREGVLLTGWYFFNRKEDGTYDRTDVDAELLEMRVKNSLTNEDTFYAVNLEHWDLDGSPEQTAESLAKLKRAVDLIHHYNPNLLIGFYRLLPRRRLNAAYEGVDSAYYQSWQAENNHIAAALEKSVDVLFPSVYTLHIGERNSTTQELWKIYATEQINEARRLAGGKPIIPYVATYYHRNGNLNVKAWQPVEPDLLLFQLSLLTTMADGLVIYDDQYRWEDLQDARLDEAIDLFRQAVDQGAVSEFLDFYNELITKNHYELMEKLNLEVQLIAKREELAAATVNKDARLAAALVREIGLLEYQLRNKIDLWPEVKGFMDEIL